MVTILLEKILTLLTGWLEAFTEHAGNVLAKLNLIEEDTSNLSDIKDNTADTASNTASVITPINNISGNTSSIKTNTDSIKADTTIIKNNINTISTNTGSTSAFCEDIANNTLDCSNRLVTIGSDTTQLRTNSNTVLSDLDKVYEALKWALVDKVTTETVEGNDTVSFDTDLTNDLVELEVGIDAEQAGSGTPSPTNIRAITGHSDKSILVNGNNVTITLGQTVYGGVLDVVNGILKITHLKAVTTSSNCTTYGGLSSNGARFTSALNAPYRFAEAICNMADIATNTTYTPGIMAVGIDNNQIYWFSIIDILGLSDLQAFKDWIDLNPVEVIYKLTTPIEVQLTPSQIATIKGINNISTEGAIKATYEETVKHYLDKQ